MKIGVSSDFLVLSYQFVFSFLFPVIFQFSKNSFFQKRAQNSVFSIFRVLNYFFENSLFLGLLKHYKYRGFSNFWVLLLLKEKKIGKKMITEIYEFWFFWSKMAVSWRTTAFQTKRAWSPIFIVFFGCALFGPRCQFCFLCFFVFFCFLEGLRVKWGGRRATSLGPKPSLFVFVVFVFCFLFCLSCFWYKKPCFPLEKGIFVYFQCFSFFLP